MKLRWAARYSGLAPDLLSSSSLWPYDRGRDAARLLAVTVAVDARGAGAVAVVDCISDVPAGVLALEVRPGAVMRSWPGCCSTLTYVMAQRSSPSTGTHTDMWRTKWLHGGRSPL
jgi:hypothetical protein